MRFQPVKCNITQITRKRIKKINAPNTSEEKVRENKYIGIHVTITNDVKWNTHVSDICTRASLDVTLWHVHRTLKSQLTRGSTWCVQS